jgi:3-phenylpropionate/trans-cinnamate dioxygenase ferredoxin component
MRVDICAADEIPAGAMRAVESGEHAVLIARVGDRLLAVSNVCTHARARLSDGRLDEHECTVECPLHNAVFSLETGEALEFPADEPIETYAVTVEGGRVFVDIPDE